MLTPNNVYEGDCLELMPNIPENSIDMVLCDLPYGNTQNHWDNMIPLEPLWEQYKRIIKPNGVVALTSMGKFTARLIMSNQKWFRYKIIWVKDNATGFLSARRRPLTRHEDICVFYHRQPTYNPQMSQGRPYDRGVRYDHQTGSYGNFHQNHSKSDDGKRFPTDVIHINTAKNEIPRISYHSCQKPVELGRYLIRTFTNPGETVLDNAFGSGSFIVAAAMEKRKYIGIELNELKGCQDEEQLRRDRHSGNNYIEVVKARLAKLEG